jgi:hypothetical protein
MGTRSITIFKDGKKEIVVMYRQMNGYMKNGHGQELAQFLAGGKMVNGIGGDGKDAKIFNGMGCLSAQTIARFKYGFGSIWLAGDEESPKIFDDKGRLSAKVVSHFKDSVGSIYLEPAGTRNCGEDFVYIVTGTEGHEPVIECYEKHYKEPDELIARGFASDVLKFIQKMQ